MPTLLRSSSPRRLTFFRCRLCLLLVVICFVLVADIRAADSYFLLYAVATRYTIRRFATPYDAARRCLRLISLRHWLRDALCRYATPDASFAAMLLRC